MSRREVAAPRAAPAPLLGPVPAWTPRAERLRGLPGVGWGAGSWLPPSSGQEAPTG